MEITQSTILKTGILLFFFELISVFTFNITYYTSTLYHPHPIYILLVFTLIEILWSYLLISTHSFKDKYANILIIISIAKLFLLLFLSNIEYYSETTYLFRSIIECLGLLYLYYYKYCAEIYPIRMNDFLYNLVKISVLFKAVLQFIKYGLANVIYNIGNTGAYISFLKMVNLFLIYLNPLLSIVIYATMIILLRKILRIKQIDFY